MPGPSISPLGSHRPTDDGSTLEEPFAVTPVDVLAIPGEPFVREWAHPFESTETPEVPTLIGTG